MDPQNLEKQREPEAPRYLSFPHLANNAVGEDGKPALNKYSSTLTSGHNFPGAQVRSPCRLVELHQGTKWRRRCSMRLVYLPKKQ